MALWMGAGGTSLQGEEEALLSAPSSFSQGRLVCLQLQCWEKPSHVQEGPAEPNLEALLAWEPGR